MSNKTQKTEKPQDSENENAALPDATKGIPETRLQCLKLAHSASKSVIEVLNDAEIYTRWVETGEKPETDNAG